ncbi:MAG TPA: M48 family metallopeptidase, partial [Polyangiaceae bacterium]|nr:M48 family metallopeptidase [Polyangiaceae bacterium]
MRLAQANAPAAGFNPKMSRFAVEILVIGAVVVALGFAAVLGGGALAAALTPVVPLSFDRKLGEIGAMTVMADECKNPAAKKYVEELARPLLAEAGELPFEFSFRVVNDEAVNAFCLPGGFVTVNRGLLEAAESGEEVAGVLGHEIQHALLRHGTRRMLREMGGSLALSLMLGGTDLHQYGSLAKDLTGLSYDRGQESEADREGVRLL